jgi:hypothetical protein
MSKPNKKKLKFKEKPKHTSSGSLFPLLNIEREDHFGVVNTLPRKREKFKSRNKKNNRWERRSLSKRADYGVGSLDLWNYAPSYYWYVLAQIVRAYPGEGSDELLEDIIFMADDYASWDFYADPVKDEKYRNKRHAEDLAHYKLAQERWGGNYAKLLERAPRAVLSASDYVHDLTLIKSLTTRPDVRWREWRGILTDQTQVVLDTVIKPSVSDNEFIRIVAKHRKQRQQLKISDLDIAYAPMEYLHWTLTQSIIYISSTETHGWDSMTFDDTWDEYSDRLLRFATGIYVLGFSTGQEVTIEDKELAEGALQIMVKIIPGLWD